MQRVGQKKKMKLSELKRLYAERWNYPPAQKKRKIKYKACGDKPIYNRPREYKACWEHPLDITPDAKFGPCWEYPPWRFKRRPLPPPCRGTIKALKLLVPTFEHCEALYTRYDFKLEQCVHQQILVIQQLFFELEQQLEVAKLLQIEMAEQMRHQAMRYRLLLGGACCTKIYPEYLSQLTEQRALCDFQKAFNVINESNCDLGHSVMTVRDELVELRARIDKLDRTLKSTFLLGDGYGMPSLDEVVEMLEHLYSYFFGVACKFKCWAQLMDPTEEFTMEDYLAVLNDKSDFESFMKAGTEKCTCKRCNNKNPLEPYIPCWCAGCGKMRDAEICDEREAPSWREPICRCDGKVAPVISPSDSDFVPEKSSTSLLEIAVRKKKEMYEPSESSCGPKSIISSVVFDQQQ